MPTEGAKDAVPKPPNGTCPFGWLSSGSFCACGRGKMIKTEQVN
jgi:hypothetical protein